MNQSIAIDETWYEHHASGYLSFVVFTMPKIEQNSSRVKEAGGKSITGTYTATVLASKETTMKQLFRAISFRIREKNITASIVLFLFKLSFRRCKSTDKLKKKK